MTTIFDEVMKRKPLLKMDIETTGYWYMVSNPELNVHSWGPMSGGVEPLIKNIYSIVKSKASIILKDFKQGKKIQTTSKLPEDYLIAYSKKIIRNKNNIESLFKIT